LTGGETPGFRSAGALGDIWEKASPAESDWGAYCESPLSREKSNVVPLRA
jgi:hypothetical protein